MHPDTFQLAAYLDGALSEDQRAELRAHVLTCPACAARLERLRGDARHIAAALSGAPVPDVRPAVRARLRRPAAHTWIGGGLWLAAATAALLVFALLVGVRGSATASRTPDRLVIVDRSKDRLVALDAASGAALGTLELPDTPSTIKYDDMRDRLYVLLAQSVIAIEPHALQPAARWHAPQQFAAGDTMALDTSGGRLYVAQPGGVVALALDSAGIAEAQTYDLGQTPGALALSPDGATLFALNAQQARLWTIDVAGGAVRSQVLASSRPRGGYLSVSRDGRYTYVLLTSVEDLGNRPALWRIDRSGQAETPALLEPTPPPWDMELLHTGQLAIPRGDGRVGGVELVAGDTLSTTARLDPDYDQHHVVAGPNGMLYGLNFTHATITRFDASTGAIVWRTPQDRGLVPWDGVYVRGGWRWPWWP